MPLGYDVTEPRSADAFSLDHWSVTIYTQPPRKGFPELSGNHQIFQRGRVSSGKGGHGQGLLLLQLHRTEILPEGHRLLNIVSDKQSDTLLLN